MKRKLVQSTLFGTGPAPKAKKLNSDSSATASSISSSAAASAAPSDTSAKSAFAVLMGSEARKPPRRETFSLNCVERSGTKVSSPSVALSSGDLIFSWSWHSNAPSGPPDGALGEVKWTTNASLKVPNTFHIYDTQEPQHESTKPVAPAEVIVTLCSNIEPASPANSLGHQFVAPRSAISISCLKSCLQKAVRRGRVESARAVAHELLCRDFVEAVRRIMVIIVEDATLHPAYPVFAWLLLAMQAGYQPGAVFHALVLQVVEDVTRCPFLGHTSDSLSGVRVEGSTSAGAGTARTTGTGSSEKMEGRGKEAVVAVRQTPVEVCESLSPSQAALVRSLLCRAAFGGMGSDIAMLKRAAAVWVHRFANSGVAWEYALSTMHGITEDAFVASSGGASLPRYRVPATSSAAHTAAAGAFPLAGIDFHCSDIIEGVLSGMHSLERTPARLALSQLVAASAAVGEPLDSVDILRKAMWEFRSSINVRMRMPDMSAHGTPYDKWFDACLTRARRSQPSEGEAEKAKMSRVDLAWMAAGWTVLLPAVDAWARAFIDRKGCVVGVSLSGTGGK